MEVENRKMMVEGEEWTWDERKGEWKRLGISRKIEYRERR